MAGGDPRRAREENADQAYVFTDVRYFGAESCFGDGPEEDEESEDDGEEDVNQFDRFTGNMDEHEEMQNGVYISPLSPPPARASITAGDRQIDPWSSADPWLARSRESTTARDTSAFVEKFGGSERLSTPITDFADRHRQAPSLVLASDVTRALFLSPESPNKSTEIEPPPESRWSRDGVDHCRPAQCRQTFLCRKRNVSGFFFRVLASSRLASPSRL